MARSKIIYAYYQGDKYVTTGTAEELGELLGVKPESIQYYSYDAYKNRVGDAGLVITRLGSEKQIEEESEKPLL